MSPCSSHSFLDQLSSVDESQRFALVRHWLAKQPLEFTAELRRDSPVLRTSVATVVACHSDVIDVLSHPDVFTVGLYAPKLGAFMLAQDDNSAHQRDKSVMLTMLPRDDMPRVRDLISKWTDEVLQSQSAQVEVVRNLSRGIPVRLVEEYFGFRGPNVETLLRWSYWSQFDNFHNHPFHQRTDSQEIHQTANNAKAEMKAYVVDLIRRRSEELTQSPAPDDVLARILRTKFPETLGFGLAQVVLNTIGLLIGAVETTSHAVVHALDQLLRRPVHLEAARKLASSEQVDEFDGYVWEALRFAPISPYMFRLTASDYTLAPGTRRAVTIPAGTTVLALTQSAMFDEKVAEWPNEFRPHRRPRDSFDFGYGLHRCVGENVGRAMIPEIVRRILRHGLPQRAAGDGWINYKQGPFPESLTVEFG